MTQEPYYDSGGITIYHGDCLDVLDALGDLAVDAVVMDPPYASGTRTEMGKASSGAMLRAGRFADRPIELDQMTTQGFVWLMRAIGQGVRPMLPEGGSVLSFIDWRQWPNLVGALETCNYRVQGMVVWDKGSIGMGNGFRRQHELICHASKGVPKVHNASVGDVLRYRRVPATAHPSPKPRELVHRLLSVISGEDAIILDPFMGSGTTLRAAKDLGRKAIGIEIEEKYCEIAAKRLAQEVLDLKKQKPNDERRRGPRERTRLRDHLPRCRRAVRGLQRAYADWDTCRFRRSLRGVRREGRDEAREA